MDPDGAPELLLAGVELDEQQTCLEGQVGIFTVEFGDRLLLDRDAPARELREAGAADQQVDHARAGLVVQQALVRGAGHLEHLLPGRKRPLRDAVVLLEQGAQAQVLRIFRGRGQGLLERDRSLGPAVLAEDLGVPRPAGVRRSDQARQHRPLLERVGLAADLKQLLAERDAGVGVAWVGLHEALRDRQGAGRLVVEVVEVEQAQQRVAGGPGRGLDLGRDLEALRALARGDHATGEIEAELHALDPAGAGAAKLGERSLGVAGRLERADQCGAGIGVAGVGRQGLAPRRHRVATGRGQGPRERPPALGVASVSGLGEEALELRHQRLGVALALRGLVDEVPHRLPQRRIAAVLKLGPGELGGAGGVVGLQTGAGPLGAQPGALGLAGVGDRLCICGRGDRPVSRASSRPREPQLRALARGLAGDRLGQAQGVGAALGLVGEGVRALQ